MATDFDFLSTVAGIAAALAGFSTLVVVVSQRVGGTRGRLVVARLLLALRLSIIAIIFCLVPFLFERGGLTEQATWRVSSALLAIAWLGHYVGVLRRLHGEGLLSHLSTLNRVNTFGTHPGSIIALALGALGLWGRFTAVVYLGGDEGDPTPPFPYPSQKGPMVGVMASLTFVMGRVALGPELAWLLGTPGVIQFTGLTRVDLARRDAQIAPYAIVGLGGYAWRGEVGAQETLLTVPLGLGVSFGADRRWRAEGRWHQLVHHGSIGRPSLFTVSAGRRFVW